MHIIMHSHQVRSRQNRHHHSPRTMFMGTHGQDADCLYSGHAAETAKDPEPSVQVYAKQKREDVGSWWRFPRSHSPASKQTREGPLEELVSSR